jgi:zinc transporter ZupT
MKFSTKQTIARWAGLIGFIIGCFLNVGSGHHPTLALFFAIALGLFCFCGVIVLFVMSDDE